MGWKSEKMYSVLLEFPAPCGHTVLHCNQTTNGEVIIALARALQFTLCMCVIRADVPLLQIILTQLQLHRSWLDVPWRKARKEYRRPRRNKKKKSDCFLWEQMHYWVKGLLLNSQTDRREPKHTVYNWHTLLSALICYFIVILHHLIALNLLWK